MQAIPTTNDAVRNKVGCLDTSWFGCAFFAFLVVVAIFLNDCHDRRLKDDALTTIERTEPLCVAIDAFTLQHGHSPASLELLIPDFLPETPPRRPPIYRGLNYEGGTSLEWRLSFWGGHFHYARTSSLDTWYLIGDNDDSYPEERWRAVW